MKESLKSHYLFEEPLNDLLECFVLVFEKEKQELLRRFNNGAEDLAFSPTVFNISDMIVYKYFNADLSFLQRAFIMSKKFKGYPFQAKINEQKSQ